MTKINREGFRTVETDADELEDLIWRHRRRIFFGVVWIVVSLLVIILGADLWMEVRSYSSYEEQSSAARVDSDASRFFPFLGKIVKYTNDGISYMDANNELIWNQSFEMVSPQIAVCENYLAVYDKGGKEIYIIKDDGIQKQIETAHAIQSVCIAKQGTIAVLMKTDGKSVTKLYDRRGNELASGEFFESKGGIPIDIALSYDATKLAVDMVDVSDGNVKSTITFYNFGSVGQNEINNNVGVFMYSDMLIPQVEYISEERMLAITDSTVIVFEGAQKPQVANQIFLTGNEESLVYNEKYIAVIAKNRSENVSHHIKIYDMKGKILMETDTELDYTNAEFLDNNELCLMSENSCELYTIHGIKRFSYLFDTKLYQIISKGYGVGYTFVLDGETKEVRLK